MFLEQERSARNQSTWRHCCPSFGVSSELVPHMGPMIGIHFVGSVTEKRAEEDCMLLYYLLMDTCPGLKIVLPERKYIYEQVPIILIWTMEKDGGSGEIHPIALRTWEWDGIFLTYVDLKLDLILPSLKQSMAVKIVVAYVHVEV